MPHLHATGSISERDPDEVQQRSTLGHLRLHHVETNEIILIPTPSKDPNDPLNWSKGFRIYLALLVCFAMFFCNFMAAGPSVAIIEITMSFFGPPGPGFQADIAKVAYFFTATALLQGLGCLLWVPLTIKYGRRPVYVICYAGYTACIAWSGAATSYGNELAARIMMGFFAGFGECLGPITIADIFFLHERGAYMALYTAALSCGVSGGIIVSGLITINLDWRYICWVATALTGALTILVALTMPETAFNRSPARVSTERENVSELYAPSTNESLQTSTPEKQAKDLENQKTGHVSTQAAELSNPPKLIATLSTRPRETFLQSLRLFHGTFTNEPLWRLVVRPLPLLLIPPVMWATLVLSVSIGFLVAISSNFASAFAMVYHFQPYQSGLCFISGIVGTLLSIFFGGRLSDSIADFFTRRNDGIREPEMRLPAAFIGLITAPLGLILYGVGINNHLHWMVPTLGLGFLSFATAQVTNVSITYTVDAYRPIAAEVILSQLAFKSCFGFLLSFYTNPWAEKYGYSKAFGTMAGICGAVLITWTVFFVFGKSIRRTTLKWPVISFVGWNIDREVGE